MDVSVFTEVVHIIYADKACRTCHHMDVSIFTEVVHIIYADKAGRVTTWMYQYSLR